MRTGVRVFAAVVALCAAAAAGFILVASTSGHSFQAGMVVLAVLAVLASAIGGVDAIRQRRSQPPVPLPDASLAIQAAQTLAELDHVAHRRFELAPAGPTLVVGPTGVIVVTILDDAAAGVAAEQHPAPGPAVHASRRAGEHPRWERLQRVVADVQRVVTPHEPAVPVRGVAVVAAGTPVPGAAVDGLSLVPVDRLVDAVSRGELLPMATVTSVSDLLARTLVPSGGVANVGSS